MRSQQKIGCTAVKHRFFQFPGFIARFLLPYFQSIPKTHPKLVAKEFKTLQFRRFYGKKLLYIYFFSGALALAKLIFQVDAENGCSPGIIIIQHIAIFIESPGAEVAHGYFYKLGGAAPDHQVFIGKKHQGFVIRRCDKIMVQFIECYGLQGFKTLCIPAPQDGLLGREGINFGIFPLAQYAYLRAGGQITGQLVAKWHLKGLILNGRFIIPGIEQGLYTFRIIIWRDVFIGKIGQTISDAAVKLKQHILGIGSQVIGNCITRQANSLLFSEAQFVFGGLSAIRNMIIHTAAFRLIGIGAAFGRAIQFGGIVPTTLGKSTICFSAGNRKTIIACIPQKRFGGNILTA